jgi:hypothetical protein
LFFAMVAVHLVRMAVASQIRPGCGASIEAAPPRIRSIEKRASPNREAGRCYEKLEKIPHLPGRIIANNPGSGSRTVCLAPVLVADNAG